MWASIRLGHSKSKLQMLLSYAKKTQLKASFTVSLWPKGAYNRFLMCMEALTYIMKALLSLASATWNGQVWPASSLDHATSLWAEASGGQ